MELDMIRDIVRETIKELSRNGLIKSFDDIAYAEISSILKTYYENGLADKTISAAVGAVSGDPYFKIIHLYFASEYTIEAIAEKLDVDISTIVRNKKRLCMEIYKRLQ